MNSIQLFNQHPGPWVIVVDDGEMLLTDARGATILTAPMAAPANRAVLEFLCHIPQLVDAAKDARMAQHHHEGGHPFADNMLRQAGSKLKAVFHSIYEARL